AIPFTVSFDGLPGVTRAFDSFKAAEVEAEMARIWGGIHYSFDISVGQTLGEAVGSYVVQNFLLPRGGAAPPASAAPVPIATPMTRMVEATRINLGEDASSGLLTLTGLARVGSILADTSGAGVPASQATPLPVFAAVTSNSVLVDTTAMEAARSQAAPPQT